MRSSGNFSHSPGEGVLVSVDSQRGKCEAVVNSNDSSVLSFAQTFDPLIIQTESEPVLDFTSKPSKLRQILSEEPEILLFER